LLATKAGSLRTYVAGDVFGRKSRRLYDQRRQISLTYDFQIRCILALGHNGSFELYEGLVRGTAITVFKIEQSPKKRIRRNSTLGGM
jgi:hypothetical protein